MKLLIAVTGMTVGVLWSRCATAEIIFESGSLGPTGITRDEVLSQSVVAANVASFSFIGVRFYVGQEAVTSRIGGHFVGGFNDTEFFGAITELTDDRDFPDSLDLSTPDVIGTTALIFPETSDDVFGGLAVPLQPGWYGLVFGSGLFGVTGRGGALANNADIGLPLYIVGQPDEQWFDASIFTAANDGYRFVVEGRFIPEPATFVLTGIGAALILLTYRRQV